MIVMALVEGYPVLVIIGTCIVRDDIVCTDVKPYTTPFKGVGAGVILYDVSR
jgi:hypothetical protein